MISRISAKSSLFTHEFPYAAHMPVSMNRVFAVPHTTKAAPRWLQPATLFDSLPPQRRLKWDCLLVSRKSEAYSRPEPRLPRCVRRRGRGEFFRSRVLLFGRLPFPAEPFPRASDDRRDVAQNSHDFSYAGHLEDVSRISSPAGETKDGSGRRGRITVVTRFSAEPILGGMPPTTLTSSMTKIAGRESVAATEEGYGEVTQRCD